MLSSVRAPRCRLSGLESPMLEPLAVDPNRSVAPAANNIASARLVFPAPAGPTSAITRVPLVDSPAMRLSFVRFTGARVARRGARAPYQETSTVRLFSAEGKRGRYGCGPGSGTLRRSPRFGRSWQKQRPGRSGAIHTATRQNRHGASPAQVG